MQVETTAIPDVLILKPRVFEDKRGYFMETFHQTRYEEAGIRRTFVQDNESFSSKNVLRGLHYQIKHPQGKLVHVLQGAVFDVAVDIREGSPTFGKWTGVTLTAENKWQFWVPEGFAHGYCVLSDIALFSYKCTDFYHPEHERGILWNDPAIGIDWPVDGTPILSDKDLKHPVLVSGELPKYRNVAKI